MKTRTSKAIGAVAGIAAIALSVPLAVTAYAQPPAEPTPAPAAPYPDLQGSGCDAFKASVPNYQTLANVPVGDALKSIPDLSTFNSAISGGFNPAVNIVPVLNNGPYVVFAPTDEAFGKLTPQQIDALKTDPKALSDFVYYHEFLGLLGVDDVAGQRPTQQGAEINVTGEGGDIKVNETTKVLCGAIQAKDARIYLIDTPLDVAAAPAAITPSATSTTATTSPTTTTTTTSTSAPTTTPTSTPTATPAADAPIG